MVASGLLVDRRAADFVSVVAVRLAPAGDLIEAVSYLAALDRGQSGRRLIDGDDLHGTTSLPGSRDELDSVLTHERYTGVIRLGILRSKIVKHVVSLLWT